MFRWLVAHGDRPPLAGMRVRTDFSRSDARTLCLTFSVFGAVETLDWHGLGGTGRHDELWRHGCFEAFVGCAAQRAYIELNFAPRQRWAAYAFAGYREHMRPEDVVIHRQEWFVRDLSVPHVEMQVLLELPSDLASCAWSLNLTTILEAKDGTKSYWALAHALGPPDFHNRDCFIATLPAPERT